MTSRLPHPFLGAQGIVHQGVKPSSQATTSKTTNVSKGVKAGYAGTHIVVVLDESSSMISCWDQTISGFNEYMDGQKKDLKDGEEAWVTVVKFDGSNVWDLWTREDLRKLPKLTNETYHPSGTTNLLDAIGITIEKVDASLKAQKKKNRPAVLFVIFTDGEENASRSFNNDMIKSLVKYREKKDWGFSFFGANIDAFSAGSAFGMQATNTMQYSTNAMAGTFKAASASTSRYRSAKLAGVDTAEIYATGMFTAEDRLSALDEDDQS